MTPFLLHDIVEPQWFDTSTTSSSSGTCAVGNSLDRIERDEEAYMNQLRTSSLVYRTNAGYHTATSQYDPTNTTTTPTNLAMCYPVIGVPLTSSTTANDVSTLPSSTYSTRMADILLQFHQEAESIDLLCVHQQLEEDEEEDEHPVSPPTTTDIPNPKTLSFFSKYRHQYQELLAQQEQTMKKATTTTTVGVMTALTPLSKPTTMKTKSNHHHHHHHHHAITTTTTPSSVSSSSMMSMNSSSSSSDTATSPSSMLFMSP